MHTLRENYKVVNFLPNQIISSATDTNGTGVDCKELETDITAVVTNGVFTGAHTQDVKFQESDTLGSGYADISGAALVQSTDADDSKIASISFKRTKRFVRAVVTTAGTVTLNPVGIVGLVKAVYGGDALNGETYS